MARQRFMPLLSVVASTALISQSSAFAFDLFVQKPYTLRCTFTSGELTTLGRVSPNVPSWAFDLKIDKKSKTVLYRGAQLVDGKFGAGSVQFFFKAMGDSHKMLLDLNRLVFVSSYSDDVSSLTRRGKCRRT